MPHPCRISPVRPLGVMALALLLGVTAVSAQSFVRIENRSRSGLQVHTEWDSVSISTAPAGWWSADWIFEPTGAANTYLIKNRFRGTYLNVEKGPLVASAVPVAFLSSQWVLEPVDGGFYRIRNLWKGTYLHAEHAYIEVGAAPAAWLSAQWKLQGFGAGAGAGAGAATTATAVAAGPAVITAVDPACLASVPWMVQPEAVDIRLIGCRGDSAIVAPDAQRWRHFDNPAGGFIETRFALQDTVTHSVLFDVRVSGGGSGTFTYQIAGVPTAQGVLKAGTFTATSGPAAQPLGASTLTVDPGCLATVAWVVNPEAADMKLTGCRAASALPAPGDGGWRTFQDDKGQTIETRGEEMDPNGVLTFTVRWNGGGSSTFVYEVRGTPNASGVLKAGTFTVGAPQEK